MARCCAPMGIRAFRLPDGGSATVELRDSGEIAVRTEGGAST